MNNQPRLTITQLSELLAISPVVSGKRAPSTTKTRMIPSATENTMGSTGLTARELNGFFGRCGGLSSVVPGCVAITPPHKRAERFTVGNDGGPPPAVVRRSQRPLHVMIRNTDPRMSFATPRLPVSRVQIQNSNGFRYGLTIGLHSGRARPAHPLHGSLLGIGRW